MVSTRSFNTYALFTLVFLTKTWVHAFSSSTNDNLAVYWGQDAAGGGQQDLSYYCADDTIDAIPIAFLYSFFGLGGDPVIDVSNICGSGSVATFPGSDLLDCSFLASDIKTCQAKGKIVTISLGGATGVVGFTSSSQAKTFAKTIWDMFLGGSSDTRPFGDAVLDGIDLDIEGGSPSYYSDFVNEIRTLSNSAAKKYYVTAAPQCPYPDANIGEALNGASFDAVYVQFYNNYCGLNAPSEFNFDTWDTWAKETSPNPDVKVYIGAPGSANAAGTGFVDADTLAGYVKDAQQKYSSFGGVMLWDASVSYTSSSSSFAHQIKNAMVGTGGGSGASTSKVTTSTSAASNSSATSTASKSGSEGHSTSTAWESASTSERKSTSSHSHSKSKKESSSSTHWDSSSSSDVESYVTSSPSKPTSTSSWTDTWWTPTQTVWWTPTQTVWWTPTQTVWWTPSARAVGGSRAARSVAPEPEQELVADEAVPVIEDGLAEEVPLNDTPSDARSAAHRGSRHVHKRFAVNRQSQH